MKTLTPITPQIRAILDTKNITGRVRVAKILLVQGDKYLADFGVCVIAVQGERITCANDLIEGKAKVIGMMTKEHNVWLGYVYLSGIQRMGHAKETAVSRMIQEVSRGQASGA